MMVIERPWKSLAIKGDYPLLFLKARLNEKRCTLQLTDLNRLWVGSLARDELLQSASDQSTTIDPSEDDEQYEQFLSKINSALNGERRTSISLEPAAAEDSLELRISAPLPGSLPTFRWNTQLRRVDKDNGSAFESDILTPLLVHANNLMSQVQHLVTELGHKDRVIGKIADKLENVGQDLGQVFPGASNPRSTKVAKRAQLAGHVEGLGEFDADKWQAAAVKDIDEEDLSVEAIDAILARLPAPGLVSAHKDTTGRWWRSRGTPALNESVESEDVDIKNDTAGRGGRPKHQTQNRLNPTSQASNDDDEFQQQRTPLQPARNDDDDDDDDEETEDEDDLDAPTQRASQGRTASQNGTDSSRLLSHGRGSSQSQGFSNSRALDTNAPPGRRIGIVGGKASARQETPEADTEHVKGEVFSSPATKAPTGSGKLGVFGHQTRSYPMLEGEASQTTTPKRGKRFGTFGGNANTTSSPPADDPQVSPGKRLGMFGGRSQNTSLALHKDADSAVNNSSPLAAATTDAFHVDDMVGAEGDETQSREQVKSEEEVEQQEREDSQERADIRREKLKRDIEEKTKGRVKKKRKF